MLVHEGITRRSFLKGLLSAAAGAGLNSFIPLPMETTGKASLARDIQPYWLEVLSRGMQYFPAHIVSRHSDWTTALLKESVRCDLLLVIGRNRNILASPGLPGGREMDEVVDLNKCSQYRYESLKYGSDEREEEEDEEDRSADDSCYARLLYDLSCFIIRDITGKVDDPSFNGFASFDLTLMNSGLTYARESIRMNEHAYDLCAAELKEVITANTGSSYNNLGLILSYLGEVQQAQEAFAKALELRPDNRAILRNLEDMDANGLIVRRRLYSGITID